MRKFVVLILAAIGLIALVVYAHPAHAQKLPFTNYNTTNGLTHNRTHTIKQDRKGYLWIGTDMGINRYDGRTFRHYPCPENRYRAARYTAQEDGNVIFSVDRYGIAICCGDSVQFIKLNAEKLRGIENAVRINDSTYYVVNEFAGVYRLLYSAVRRISASELIIAGKDFTDIFKDRKNNVWLLSASGLTLFPRADFTHPVQVPFFAKQYINSIRQDSNGDIYIACHTGVFRYQEEKWQTMINATPERIFPPGDEITSLTFDKDGNVWMSTTFKGLYRYDKLTKTVSNFSISNGLVSKNTWDVFCDKENNIWVASENGIGKLTATYFTSFDLFNADYQNVKSACELNDSTLLFSNLVDLYKYERNEVTKINSYSNIPGFIEDLFLKMPDNKLLVNVNDRIDAGSFSVYSYLCELKNDELVNRKKTKDLPLGVKEVYINHGAALLGNAMWVNTSEGLMLYKDGRFNSAKGVVGMDKDIVITYITQNRNGDLWIVNGFNELIRYSVSPSHQPGFPYVLEQKQRITADKLNRQYCHKVLIDAKGNLWLCTREKGVYILRTDAGGNVTKIDTFAPGTFSSGLVNCVTEDDAHNIWVGTASGLDKVTFKNDSLAVVKDVYGSELCGKYIYFVKKVGGRLFVGTTGCVGIINTKQPEHYTAPDIYITGLKINGNDVTHLLSTTPLLKTNENILSFVFTGISFKDESRIRYSYMLEGLSGNWSEPQTDYSITYSQIPPGTYTFKVKAVSVNGIWSVLPASFTFTIAQPFYTRWWFIAFVIVAISSIIYYVYRYRINQILKIQNIRQSISKDLHDDIGATVSSINILANIAKSSLVSESKRNQFLETIQEESKHVSESLNDIVWNINPKNDSLDVMFAKMQRYASELFEARNIAYTFILPQTSFSEQIIDMRQRQHIYLIYKEAVNNLAKYAEASQSEITLSVTKKEFIVVISDNGKGFDVSTGHSGNGIFNMKKRANDINAVLSIDSSPGNGTRITLRLTF